MTKKIRKQSIEWMETIAVSWVFIIIVFTFFLKICVVFQESMLPTLVEGDKVVLNCVDNNITYGDIIVVGDYKNQSDRYVKRVIALEGDTVDIDNDSGVLYVNGIAQQEDYVTSKTMSRNGQTQFPLVVDEDSFFVLGDNRERSKDSRNLDIGIIDERTVLGTVVFRISPFDKIGVVK